jgi:hypothetical protein
LAPAFSLAANSNLLAARFVRADIVREGRPRSANELALMTIAAVLMVLGLCIPNSADDAENRFPTAHPKARGDEIRRETRRWRRRRCNRLSFTPK